jgi:hypothetical protein
VSAMWVPLTEKSLARSIRLTINGFLKKPRKTFDCQDFVGDNAAGHLRKPIWTWRFSRTDLGVVNACRACDSDGFARDDGRAEWSHDSRRPSGHGFCLLLQ